MLGNALELTASIFYITAMALYLRWVYDIWQGQDAQAVARRQ